jgi:hypothetical protein
MAYEWCSAICEGHPGFGDGEELLFLSLKIGFRGLDFRDDWLSMGLVHTKHCGRMGEIVFNSGDDEAIADLLQAWVTFCGRYRLRNLWPRLLVRLRPATFTSQRLRQLVIRSVECVNFQEAGDIKVEELTALLDCLHVGVDDIRPRDSWLHLLIYIVRSPEGRRTLSYPYWELLVELAVGASWLRNDVIEYDQQAMSSFEDEEEWDKLECWSGFIWLLQRPKIDTITEDLERATLSLSRQRPGAVRKLEQWMQRSPIDDAPEALECLRWICERGGLEAVSQGDSP